MLRGLLLAWRLVIAQTHREAEEMENARLKAKINQKANSLWTMTKEELVSEARRCLHMTIPEAQSKTVLVLRELLKRDRDKQKIEIDPELQIPKGLDRMKKEELIAEMVSRELIVTNKMTRPQMVVEIRDHIQKLTTAATATPLGYWDGVESGYSAAQAAAIPVDYMKDWMTVDADADRRVRRPPPQA